MKKLTDLRDIADAARESLEEAISKGITLEQIYTLADMVSAIHTLEKYLCGDDNPEMHEVAGWHKGRIESEFKAAEAYYQEYLKSRQEIYRQIARDELRHAETIMRQAQAQGEDLSGYQQKLNALVQKIG